jgi:hypothetical protein
MSKEARAGTVAVVSDAIICCISVSPDILENTMRASKVGRSRRITDEVPKVRDPGEGPWGAGQCEKTTLVSNPPSWHSCEMEYLDLGVA